MIKCGSKICLLRYISPRLLIPSENCYIVFLKMPGVEVNDALGNFLGRVREGETKAVALQRLVTPSAVLLDKDGIALLDDEVLTHDKAPYTLKPQHRGQQDQDINVLSAAVKGLGLSIHAMQEQLPSVIVQDQDINELSAAVKGLRLSIHAIQEQLPSVIVGHVITPSTASRDRQVSAKVFEAVGLPLRPAEDSGEYALPEPLENSRPWKFSFTWSTNENDGRVQDSVQFGDLHAAKRESSASQRTKSFSLPPGRWEDRYSCLDPG